MVQLRRSLVHVRLGFRGPLSLGRFDQSSLREPPYLNAMHRETVPETLSVTSNNGPVQKVSCPVGIALAIAYHKNPTLHT